MQMPGTLDASEQLQRVGMTGRPGKSGVFAAYGRGGPSQSSVLVWRVGAMNSTTLAVNHTTELGFPAIATTPDGRLWVAWASAGRISARRSNPSATQWGAVSSIPVEHETATTYKLAVNATDGVLDVLGAFQLQGGTGVQTWHSQMLAGLTLTASPASLKLAKGKSGKLKLTVTDADVAVKGAHLSAGGHSATTSKVGSATITVGPFTHSTTLQASASATGYVAASVRVHMTVH